MTSMVYNDELIFGIVNYPNELTIINSRNTNILQTIKLPVYVDGEVQSKPSRFVALIMLKPVLYTL
jgi:hypothetical protein